MNDVRYQDMFSTYVYQCTMDKIGRNGLANRPWIAPMVDIAILLTKSMILKLPDIPLDGHLLYLGMILDYLMKHRTSSVYGWCSSGV